MSERLAAMYPTREAMEHAVAAVRPAQDIRYGGTVSGTWHNLLLDLREQPASIWLIVEEAQRGHGEAPGVREVAGLMGGYEAAQADFHDGVHATDDYRLVPVGLEEHHHKARIFAGTSIERVAAQPPISHALLEIGPTIAAQESDYQIARAIENLGRLNESRLLGIMNKADYRDDEVAPVAMQGQDSIDTIRGYARASIEFSDLVGEAATTMPGYEPIRVVLECKLRQNRAALPLLNKFLERVHQFEQLNADYVRTGTESKKLVVALQAACARASSICAPLYDNLERHLDATRQAITSYLKHPDPQVSSLLSEIRLPSHSTPPAPALWLKTPVTR